jgi:hypothetical protein
MKSSPPKKPRSLVFLETQLRGASTTHNLAHRLMCGLCVRVTSSSRTATGTEYHRGIIMVVLNIRWSNHTSSNHTSAVSGLSVGTHSTLASLCRFRPTDLPRPSTTTISLQNTTTVQSNWQLVQI